MLNSNFTNTTPHKAVILSAAKDLLLRFDAGRTKSRSFAALRMTAYCCVRVVLALAWVMPAAFAQTPRKLTLREAAQLTLQNNRAIQLAAIAVDRAAAEQDEAKSIFRPQVMLGSGLAYSKGFPLSIEGSTPSIFQVN